MVHRSSRIALCLASSVALLGCRKPGAAPADGGTTLSAASPATRASAASPASVRCSVVPTGGVALPASSRATDVRLATAGGKTLVTWFEQTKQNGGPDALAAYAHVFDGETVGPRVELDSSTMGDEFPGGAAAVATATDLSAITCYYAAPSGHYSCSQVDPTLAPLKPKKLFAFGGIATGGPTHAGVAAVARASDVVLFVPEENAPDVLAFTSRASGPKKSYPFAIGAGGSSDQLPHAEGISAVLTGADEAAVVYRTKHSIRARRIGFDQAWRGKAVELAAKGALVGAPVAASEGPRVVALFSERAKATEPWKVMLSDWAPGAEPKTTLLPTGDAQAQGPAITTSAGSGCFLVSWVEGTGKTTTTRLARMCGGVIAPPSVATISTTGAEGGRATLATDPADAGASVVVWQEIPAGKPAELRVAKLACR